MFALGQEADAVEEHDRKVQAMENVTQFRDQLFEQAPMQIIKIITGVVVGSYIVYRLLR